MGDELWYGQAQNGVNLDFDLIFDLEGQGQSLHKTKLASGKNVTKPKT